MRYGMKVGKHWYALFVFPLMAVFITVVIIPFITGIGYAFVEWNGLAKVPKEFIGFQNFREVFQDQSFWSSLGRTVIFTAVTVCLVNIIALAFALMVTAKVGTRNVARTMFFLPYMIGGLILGYIWKFILGEGMSVIGEMLGRPDIFFNWLTNKQMAFVAIIVVAVWQMSGYIMIIYIAGLGSISEDVLESAAIEGTGPWMMLTRIKLPLIMHSITICLFLTLSYSFKVYDVNLSLTGGGPNHATQLISMTIFNEIFTKRKFGYGQSMAILFFILIAFITLAQVHFTSDKEVEE